MLLEFYRIKIIVINYNFSYVSLIKSLAFSKLSGHFDWHCSKRIFRNSDESLLFPTLDTISCAICREL